MWPVGLEITDQQRLLVTYCNYFWHKSAVHGQNVQCVMRVHNFISFALIAYSSASSLRDDYVELAMCRLKCIDMLPIQCTTSRLDMCLSPCDEVRKVVVGLEVTLYAGPT